MKDDSKELINDISDLLRQIANDLEDEDTSEEDETLSGYSVIDLVTEVVNLVGPENYKETLHLEDADGNITMVTSVTLSNGKVTLHHSGE